MRAYLNYAGIGIVRPAAREAMRTAVDEVLAAGAGEYGTFFAARERARRAAARLLDCHDDEIALVQNTSTALHLVADGFQWQAGDEVVVFDRDFPANMHPWRRLTGRGVRLRVVPMRDGGYDLAEVAERIGPATRLVAVSYVNFLTGFRIDLDAICALAREVGALVCVDAVQGLGALPLSVASTPVDFLAAAGHKWLCAPPGTGLFFCRRSRLDLLRWAPAGWFGYDRSQDMLVLGEEGHFTYDLVPRPSARRFEGGMPNLLGFVGLAEALEEIEAIGLAAISRRVLSLARALREGLLAAGYPVLGSAAAENGSGIVTFDPPEARALHAGLAAAGFPLSIPDGRIRVAPHYWTSISEIEDLLVEVSRVSSTY